MQNNIFECTNQSCTIFKQGIGFKHKSCNSCPFKKVNLSITVKNTTKSYNNSTEHVENIKYFDDGIKSNDITVKHIGVFSKYKTKISILSVILVVTILIYFARN